MAIGGYIPFCEHSDLLCFVTTLISLHNFPFVCLFVCLGGFRPIREIFTRMEKSPLSVKGCKLLTYAVGTYDH